MPLNEVWESLNKEWQEDRAYFWKVKEMHFQESLSYLSKKDLESLLEKLKMPLLLEI